MSRRLRRKGRKTREQDIQSLPKYQEKFVGKICTFSEPNTRLILVGTCRSVILSQGQILCQITGVHGRGSNTYSVPHHKCLVAGGHQGQHNVESTIK